MNKEVKKRITKEAHNLSIQHTFDPWTGEHLPQCKMADELYNQMIDNLLKTSKPIFRADNKSV